jgi:hypothetical protein
MAPRPGTLRVRSVNWVQSLRVLQLSRRSNHARMMRGGAAIVNEMEF